MKIFSRVTSVSNCITIQTDSIRSTDFCVKDGLYINFEKCSVVSSTRNVNSNNFPYKLNEITMNRVESVRDLELQRRLPLEALCRIVITNCT